MVLRGCDDGVTEIIGFVLIMGLVVMVLFIMALVVPPMNGAALEGELAQSAVQEMSDLKYDMDLIWEGGEIPSNVTRSVLIQLSTQKQGKVSMLPVFAPNTGSATLSCGVSDLTLNISGERYDNLLWLMYSTSNNYAPNMVVMYDAGAVFGGTAEQQSMILAPSVGRAADGSMLIVLPVLEGPASSASSNNFGIVEYSTVDVNQTPKSYTNPTIEITSSNAAVMSMWKKMLKTGSWNEVTGVYYGTVRVKTVKYSMVVRGAFYEG